MSSNAYTEGLVGFRVRVISKASYDSRCLDYVGTVKACYGQNNIAVKLDLLDNRASKKGYFYFKRSDLELIGENNDDTTITNKGEETMQTITNYLNIAVIRFLDDDTPFRNFECANFSPDLNEGDICVVMTAHHGMGLAEVEELKNETGKELTREVVSKVYDGEYRDRVKQREQAAKIKAAMQQRAKQLQDIVLYQTLAKDDPEMAELLKNYQALGF